MSTTLGSVIRRAVRKPGDRLNVLSFPTHESYQNCLSSVNAEFYLFRGQGIKDWNPAYRTLPKNHHLLDSQKGERQLPLDVDFDVVLSQNLAGQFPVAYQVSKKLHIPLINLTHTLPPPGQPPQYIEQAKSMKGDINIFISDFNRSEWGWSEDEAVVLHHGIDTGLFKPGRGERQERILSVVNDWINRDWCCGYKTWERLSKFFPGQTYVLGDTPGLSKPAKSTFELVKAYQESRIFLNTSTVSPVPTALMEAMAAGCACVSTATCMIPTIIQNGVNGFITNDEKEMRQYLQTLLDNPDLAAKLGAAARQTIEEKFSIGEFVKNWDAVLEKAASLPFTP